MPFPTPSAFRRFFSRRAIFPAALCLGAALPALAQPAHAMTFEIAFPSTLHAARVTGRMFVFVAKNGHAEPRHQIFNGSAVFAVNVSDYKPGAAAIIDQSTPGFPPASLKDIPPGDYYVQALLNIYTEFHRADGHVIWAHMDQWEGQDFTRSPGNLISETRKLHLDPAQGYRIKLDLTKKIPAIEMPADTPWVKRIKLESPLLSRFWGRPIFIGATVLLPKGYDEHPAVHYPTMYLQGHFSLDAPFGFSTELNPAEKSWAREKEQARAAHLNLIEPPAYSHYNGALENVETGHEFYQAWNADKFPRMIAVTFQHPTPYYDDSYAVNSENEGPYGDAIMTELIPYLESHFRMIPKAWARTLTGGSTGGWESFALQVYHPDFFGGVWTFYPDPVDLRRYNGGIDIYTDENAFSIPRGDWLDEERLASRTIDGQTRLTVRQMSRLQSVIGDKERCTIWLNDYEVVMNPVGPDGYPVPLWDKATGKMNRDVARYARERGFDLREYLERNWPRIGRNLAGKLHLSCGESDGNFLNLALYLLQDFLENTTTPYYRGSFEFGRPLKGHGWQPTTSGELVEKIAAAVTENAPKEGRPDQWRY